MGTAAYSADSFGRGPNENQLLKNIVEDLTRRGNGMSASSITINIINREAEGPQSNRIKCLGATC